jgi:hypothetical protein
LTIGRSGRNSTNDSIQSGLEQLPESNNSLLNRSGEMPDVVELGSAKEEFLETRALFLGLCIPIVTNHHNSF